MGCEAKYELTKKSVKEEYFRLKLRLLVKKRRVIYVIYKISDKIESKNRSLEIKWNCFLKRSFENFRPPKAGAKSPPMAIDRI